MMIDDDDDDDDDDDAVGKQPVRSVFAQMPNVLNLFHAMLMIYMSNIPTFT